MTTTVSPISDLEPTDPRVITNNLSFADRVFSRVSLVSGLAVLVIMSAVGLFLSIKALEALRIMGFSFFTTSEWKIDQNKFGIAAVLLGSVSIALVAVGIGAPVALGTALFITEVAPLRIRSMITSLVDLMAAVPSVVYGIWGMLLFNDLAIGLSRWLATWMSWIPFFRVEGADPTNPLANPSVYSSSVFIAGMVVALMIIPLQCSIMREVFSQVPSGEREAAFALGSTRWGMIRTVALPFGRGGIIGGTILGLGRALGETIAVVLILSTSFDIKFRILEIGGNSVASLIALNYGEASVLGISALMAAGLVLFAMTLVVNFAASIFVNRSRSGSSSEA